MSRQTPGFRGLDKQGRQQCLTCWGWKYPALHSCPGVPQAGRIPPPTPQRIQRRRTKGWRMPYDAVYVGRPSRWGNPFTVGRVGNAERWTHWYVGEHDRDWKVWAEHQTEEAARRHVVDLFALHIGPMGNYEYDGDTLTALRRDLTGRDLVCWCPLDQPCHADVLIEIANPNVAAGAGVREASAPAVAQT